MKALQKYNTLHEYVSIYLIASSATLWSYE
jgi:hypothetical protein